jgi:hypothetical protein
MPCQNMREKLAVTRITVLRGGENRVVIAGGVMTKFVVRGLTIVGLLAGGPVGRFKLAASRDGGSIEADRE